MIPFNKPSITPLETEYVNQAMNNKKICGDGEFTKKASAKLSEILNINLPLITTSCSHALDMSAMLLDLKQGDEAIVPSYTFVSTANAIMLRNATPVFVDIDPRTMNIDADKIEQAITPKTKAIFVVHYAGVACDMDKICSIANKYKIPVVEDAAQGVGAYYKGKALGSIGEIGCYSFHETKNYVMGEGGALIFKDEELRSKAEIIREKGTDRSRFLRGQIDKYTWQEVGSSYLPSDMLTAILLAQLERFDEIMQKRMHIWNSYQSAFEELEKAEKLKRPFIPEYAQHNAHLYYLILPTSKQRDEFISFLKSKDIGAVFHYVPLHTSPVGQKLGYKEGDLPFTEDYSSRLVRLPLFADMTNEETEQVIKAVFDALK